MSRFRTNHCFHARSSTLSIGLLGLVLVGGCAEDPPGLGAVSTAGRAGAPSAGSSSESGAGAGTAVGGNAGTSSTSSPATAGSGDSAPQGGSSAGGVAPVPAAGAGGDSEPEASAGAGGQAGETGEVGVHLPPACLFHTDAAPVQGAAGAGSETPTVTVQLSPFVGSYLADGSGRALYTYGGDLPGDCNTQPQSLCTADCPVTWPPFDAGSRVLAAGISDAGFGTIEHADGSHQTTYMGWPLYYNKSDLTLGSVTGQGKGKVWHLAELSQPSVMIMKAGANKYLADGAGRTLYVSAADQSGTTDTDPVSNCSGACLATFEAFHDNHLSVVSSLEPLDFSVFVRHGTGGLQLAYKGKPLYRAATDLKSGDMNGTVIAGFTAAVP